MNIRLPSGLKERIAASAQANGRTLNAEIVHRLEQALGETSGGPPPDETAKAIFEIREMVTALHDAVKKPQLFRSWALGNKSKKATDKIE